MSCKHYEAQLIEAAAAREAVRPALQAHLAACRVCRERYAGEQALFAAIDAELSVIADAEPTAAFVPRMRAVLQQERSCDKTTRKWFAWWPQAAAVAAVCVVAAVVIPQLRVARRNTSGTAITAAVPHTVAQLSQSSAFAPGTTPNAERRNLPISDLATSHVVSRSVAGGSGVRAPSVPTRLVAERSAADEAFAAEILVPPDERDALARLVESLRSRQDSQVALAQPAIVPSSGAATQNASLAQPADVLEQSLEIAELKVEPLRPAEEK